MKTVSPQLERRRALRRHKRRELLLNGWRTIALLGLSTALGWLLLRHGWTLEGTQQVVVLGKTGISPELVSRIGQFNFPQPLLEVDPSDLENRLRSNLPVQSARVSRQVLPARLEITLVGKTPVARGIRRTPSGREEGMIDADGQWIQPNPAAPTLTPTTAITVDGWALEHRDVIAKLLGQQQRFNEDLKRIVVLPDGAISLRCKKLGRVDLGNDISRLPQQIDAIVELNQTLPSTLMQATGTVIDLSNPERPEIQLPVKPADKNQVLKKQP